MMNLLAALLLCLVLSTNAFAQTSNATLGGTVSDASGALIPGVSVTATNTQTGIVNTALTNEAGAYQFASLQPGIYRLSAELAGFQTRTYSDVVLGVSQQVRLNFVLELGGVATAIDVTVSADTLLATTSSSVGNVLPEYKVRDLPLPYRDVLGLIMTTAGAQGTGENAVFAGSRFTAVNTTRDGMSMSDGRFDNGAYSVTYTSPDLVNEVRVIVSPADAEMGGGSGQVQMSTRSGTNQFRGSVFWANRNSALDSNSWFNNFRGDEIDYFNRNQFGGRLGGPVIHNKTFFFFLYEGQRVVERRSVIGQVLTAEARRGIFRFFPNVQNANVFSSNPTVDISGNPVTPEGATGPLQSFNVFTRDPLRTGFDASGYIPLILSNMPLPNDFTVGDGLNTAGIRWVRRDVGTDHNFGRFNDTVNRDQYNFRVDHNFSPEHKLSVVGTREDTWAVLYPTNWPTGENGQSIRFPALYQASLVSTLSSNIVNESRVGWRKSASWHWTAMTLKDTTGKPGQDPVAIRQMKLIPLVDGRPFLPKTTLFGEHAVVSSGGTMRGQDSPLLSFSDTLSWVRGQHAFKGGFEARLAKSTGGSNPDLWPQVFLGAGSNPVTGIDNTAIAGLVAANQTTARNLLTDLSGSVNSIRESFIVVDSRNPEFKVYPEVTFQNRDWRQNDWSVFFKDDWKIRPSVTLNIGVRYDYFGVYYENRGMMAFPVGGSAGLFGLSGTSFADLWQPGLIKGSLTAVELVGKNSPNPAKQAYDDDWNNFGPAVGVSWSLPWGGQDKTILRAGYGLSYAGSPQFLSGINNPQNSVPGTSSRVEPVMTSFTSLADVRLPVSRMVTGIPGPPLAAASLTDRSQALRGFDNDHAVPYIQNFNMELQRELARNLTMEIRYVGSKGTKLQAAIPINAVNIFENGILEAFDITRAGGNAPLFDRMLNGLNLGLGPVNGTSVTGSASLRQNTLFRSHIANGNVGQFAAVLDATPTATGQAGGLLRNGGMPENFILVNPQFNSVLMDSNPGNSTYHSLNLQVTKRLSQGFTNQTTYTWSRAIGEADADGVVNYFDPRDRSLNKSLLGYHRTHNFRSNGTFELPFGPNRPLLSDAPALVQRLVEQWQLGAIVNVSSGQPLSITAPTSTIHQFTGNMPVIVGDFARNSGTVTQVANGVIYFDGLGQVTDPARNNVTTLQAAQGAFNQRAITDAQGNLLLVNPQPGKLGTLGARWIEGPGSIGLDVNFIKRVRIDESKDFEVRLDAINVLNRPNFGNPELSINSVNFGRITSSSGSRSFVLNARVNF